MIVYSSLVKDKPRSPSLPAYIITFIGIFDTINKSQSMLRRIICFIFLSFLMYQDIQAQKKSAGNPVIEGWYADPEGVIFNNQYWIFPTFSARYKDQVFMDAFSSVDMVNWKNIPALSIPVSLNGPIWRCGHHRL